MSTLAARLADLADKARSGSPLSYAPEMGDLLIELNAAYGYEIAMLEQHSIEHPSTITGYVLCCPDRLGRFTKWSKTIGGDMPGDGRGCDYAVFDLYSDAETALLHLDLPYRHILRIFPVVLSAGLYEAKAQ